MAARRADFPGEPSPRAEGSSSARRPRSPLRRVALFSLWVLFLIVLVEGGSYVALTVSSDVPVSADDLLERMRAATETPVADEGRRDTDFGNGIHPYLGFMTRDRDHAVTRRGLAMNQAAFYEPGSPIFDTDPNVLVVGIAGGSVADRVIRGGGLDVLVEGLSKIPRFAGKEVRIALLAFGGWKQPQQLMAVNLVYVLGGHLDLLIEIDGFNEVALHEVENQNQRVAPVYPRGWFFLTQREEVLPDFDRLNELRQERRDGALAAVDSLLRHSWAYRLRWSRRDARLRRDINALQHKLRDYEPRPASLENRDLVLSGPASPATNREGRLDELVDVWVNASLQLERLCLANGVEYFHFLQPNQYDPNSKRLTEEELTGAYDPSPERFAPLVVEGYPRLRRAADRLLAEGVRFHDLTPIFVDVDETIYVDNCCHVNELGNRLLAGAIVEFVATGG